MFIKRSVNQNVPLRGGDIYRTILLQNRLLFTLAIIVLLSGGLVCAALIVRPTPVLLVDEQGRYLAKVDYLSELPLSPVQLEVMAKRFVQHYLSQNSATLYEDAAIALAAMCPSLRTQTQNEWLEGGRLARIVQRLQLSRVIFADFSIEKYLSAKDIQVIIAGKLLISEAQGDITETPFLLNLTFSLVPLTSRNYLGIEVCGIDFS